MDDDDDDDGSCRGLGSRTRSSEATTAAAASSSSSSSSADPSSVVIGRGDVMAEYADGLRRESTPITTTPRAGGVGGPARGKEAEAEEEEEELPEECPPQWELGCSTRLSMRVQVPRPLSLAPSFLLGGAFSVIAGAVMQVILPRFAEFLAADYKRWANGEDREAPVGSFVDEDDDDADGEKDGKEKEETRERESPGTCPRRRLGDTADL